jgi:uncharacterized protein YaaW (UPF0174 family)
MGQKDDPESKALEKNKMKKEINSLCRICTRNNNDEYCEMGNDSYGNNSLRYMNDCEDFVLKEQDDENEDSINNKDSLKNNKEMDKDLLFLRNADNCDLKVLVDYLTKTKDGENRFTEELTMTENYKKYYPDQLQLMAEDIAEELQLYGGNTFMNILRGHGVEYRELLIDVCKRLKVNFNKESSIEMIEYNLLQKILLDSLENMTIEELKKILDEMNIPTQGYGKQAFVAALQMAIKRGGFSAYKIAVIVANAVSRALIGRGLTIAANAAITRWLSVFAGPIGWTVTAIWTAIDIAGPAYRVTIPSVVQIAYMRIKMISKTADTTTDDESDN